jgi:molybdate transport system permease protein
MMIDTEFWSPIILSLEVSSAAVIFVLLLGLLLGKFMAGKQFKGKVLLDVLFLIPIVLPPSVIGFLLIIIFGTQSPIGQMISHFFGQSVMFTWWAAVIASTVVAFPLMYQSVKTGFEGIDRDIEGAAMVDGANEWKLFMYISIPLAIKSIISGAILSFARALGEFGATLMFAGNIPGKTATIPTAIYIAFDSGNMQLAWLWVLCIILISFFMLVSVKLINH